MIVEIIVRVSALHVDPTPPQIPNDEMREIAYAAVENALDAARINGYSHPRFEDVIITVVEMELL